MATSEQRNPSIDQHPSERASRGSKRQSAERVLPKEIQASLRDAVRKHGAVDEELVGRMIEAHELDSTYGLSRRRVRNYLNRLHRKISQGSTKGSHVDGDADWRQRVASHRHRQASVASILDATFGRLAECHPDLWDRRAYLMLVGIVYERLALQESEIDNNELTTLAKILAEGRRAQGRGSSTGDPGEVGVGADRNGKLPGRFADVVQQVYGTSFRPPEGVSFVTEGTGGN